MPDRELRSHASTSVVLAKPVELSLPVSSGAGGWVRAARVAAALGASDLTISNENRQIPSGALLTPDADADRPRTSHLRTHAPSGCARVKKRMS